MPSLLRRLHDRMSAARSDAGFTVLEVLVAFIIFGFVATAATMSIVNGSKTSTATRSRITATNLAQQSLATARAMSQTDLNDASGTTGVNGYQVMRTVSFQNDGAAATSCPTAVDPGHVHTVMVSVTVTPPTSIYARTVTMETVISCKG